MSTAMMRVFESAAGYNEAMGSLHASYLVAVRRDIESFLNQNKNLSTHMQGQAKQIMYISGIAASLAVLGSMIPKGAAAGGPLNPRLNAREGISDAVSSSLKWLNEQVQNSELLRSASKAASKLFSEGVLSASQLYGRSQTTGLEARVELMRLAFQEGNGQKSSVDQQRNRAQDAVQTILNNKSRAYG